MLFQKKKKKYKQCNYNNVQTKYTLSQNQNHPDSTTISQIQLILHLDSEQYDISNGKHSVLQKQLKPKPRNKTQTQTHSHSLSL